jgi:NAD(P)-dependent dehydrogenase (short-subunit alcohol dehydrogenase family)
VVLAARRTAALEDQLKSLGGTGKALTLDVTDADQVRNAIGQIAQIDILVNNAGLVRSAPVLDQSEEDWDAVLDTNLKGMFLVAQAVARKMRDTGSGGSIINVASILGIRQAGGVLPYSVSKAGVIQLSKSLALELARFKIRVNTLAPGYLATDLNREFFESPPGQDMIRRIPSRRLGNLEDLDGPLLLLASDASLYVTGSTIAVDGGHLVSTL